MEKTYKDFEKEFIGMSDMARLILEGPTGKEVELKFLYFGIDNDYRAYIVEGEEVKIGSHYSKEAEFKKWLRIYDDDELTKVYRADEIIVYRAGEMGCIIQLINHEKENEA